MFRSHVFWMTMCIAAAILLVCPAEASAQAKTVRVSVSSGGGESDGASGYPSISRFGRFTAFDSKAKNLVAGDTNNDSDIFVHDGWAGTTVRVSVSTAGVEANDGSYYCCISADGHYVSFNSYADNLVSCDTNWMSDIYVHDLHTATTVRASVNFLGEEGDSASYGASISGDGRYVAFFSSATNLIGCDLNYAADIFVKDMQTGTVERVSVSSAGVEADMSSKYPSISRNGRYVAFQSRATNLVAGDTNGCEDVFVHDRWTGQTVRASADSSGVEGNKRSHFVDVSSNGVVTFYSEATNLVAGDTNGYDDVFVHDVNTSVTVCASVDSSGVMGNGNSMDPDISEDGRFVVYLSAADNLVPGDTNGHADTFVHDLLTNQTTRVSVDSSGAQADWSSSYGPSITPDGRFTTFSSNADNLVPGDTNGYTDIYVHGIPMLDADTFTLPEAGGTVNFRLDGGAANSGRGYLILGSVTGVAPGMPLPGGMVTLPLNWDPFTNIVIALVNTPVFSGFMANLDGSGLGTAQMNTTALPPGTAGLVMYFAYGLSGPYDFVSNPVAVEVVP